MVEIVAIEKKFNNCTSFIVNFRSLVISENFVDYVFIMQLRILVLQSPRFKVRGAVYGCSAVYIQ